MLKFLPTVLGIAEKILVPRVKTVVTEYDTVSRGPVSRVYTKPWFTSRAMVSAVLLVGVGIWNLFNGGALDATDIDTITQNLDSVLMILLGGGAAVGRLGIEKTQ